MAKARPTLVVELGATHQAAEQQAFRSHCCGYDAVRIHESGVQTRVPASEVRIPRAKPSFKRKKFEAQIKQKPSANFATTETLSAPRKAHIAVEEERGERQKPVLDRREAQVGEVVRHVVREKKNVIILELCSSLEDGEVFVVVARSKGTSFSWSG
eukprot:6186412-Pleurochrysis_carterae.AAC.3